MRDLTLMPTDVNAKVHYSTVLCYRLSRNAAFQWEELNFERGPNPGNSSGQHRGRYHWNVSLQSTMLICAFWAPQANRGANAVFLHRVACRFIITSAWLSEVCPVITDSFKWLVMRSRRWAVFYETNLFCLNFTGKHTVLWFLLLS